MESLPIASFQTVAHAASQLSLTHSEKHVIYPLLHVWAHRRTWLTSVTVIDIEGSVPPREHNQFCYLGSSMERGASLIPYMGSKTHPFVPLKNTPIQSVIRRQSSRRNMCTCFGAVSFDGPLKIGDVFVWPFKKRMPTTLIKCTLHMELHM